MPSAERVDEILAGIYGEVSSPTPTLPQLLVDACTQTLRVTGAGLILLSDSGMAVIATSDGVAQGIEDLQFTMGEGPAFDSSSTGRPVLQPDLKRTGPERWPELTSGAAALGVQGFFAFPLQFGAIRLGVLDLHRDAPGSLDRGELAEALAFAEAAANMLVDMQVELPAGALHAGLAQPLENRHPLHQATGVIAVQASVTLAQALVLLRAKSFALEQPVLEVARHVLDHTCRFDD